MKIYKIWCEWDMGFAEAYSTREKAQKDIDEADWEGLVGSTLEEVINDGMVQIEEIEID